MFSIFRPWQLGKIFGIPIRMDPGWILIFLLLTYQLATVVFPFQLGVRVRRGIPFELLALSVFATLLLFASVLAHEMAHALMARLRHVRVLGITLFIFGGVAQITDEPDSPMTEFLIAIVGPLISFVLAILAAGVWIWTQALASWGTFQQAPIRTAALYVTLIAFYLAQANLLLGLFNLLPGFPLDGGRVLRAIVWSILRDQKRATYWGMVSGRGVALLIAGVGLFFIVQREYDGGWLLLMAWFLWRAAGDAYHSLVARVLLKHVTVAEIMRPPLPRVSETLSLRELAESFASRVRPPALAVDLYGNAVGLVGIEQVKKFARAQWESTRVRQAMLPLVSEIMVEPHDAALDALKRLSESERDDAAVMLEGQVIGLVGRQELSKFLQSHGE